MDSVDTSGFQPKTVDKVNRLLDLLEEIQRHPDLKGKLAMHGGTAINLFMLNVPRLSVDIDISYVGSLGREQMLAERPAIERGLEEVAQFQGYDVSPGEGGHAGRTLVLRYRGDWGPDHVKIDCIYMNRSPLLPLRQRQCSLRPDSDVLMFDDVELAGGKVKAFFDRVKIRDLYDISNLGKHFAGYEAAGEDEPLIHKSMLYHASISACFPNEFKGRGLRFADKQKELEDQLLPMLRLGDEEPTLEGLIGDSDAFIEKYVLPKTDSELEYLERFARGDYQPQLLFGEEPIAQAALNSPEAQWKLTNLKKMQ